MAQPTLSGPRIPREISRRLELGAASAWESLVRTHVRHALNLVGLMEEHFGYEESIDRYLREMNVGGAMAAAVRNRAMVHLQGVDPSELAPAGGLDDGRAERRGPLRLIGKMVQGLRERVVGNREVDTVLSLVFARSEEGVMQTHVRFAVSFAETLHDILPPEKAVQEYVNAVDLGGCRAQAVQHRAMAQLADTGLPDLDGDGIPGFVPGGG